MRVKIVSYAVLIFIIALIQSTVLGSISVFNVKPNLLLILIVSVALLGSNVEGAVIGFFCGLTQDMLSGRVIGFYALLGLYLGLGVAFINKRLYRENVLVAIFTTFISTIVYEFAVYFFSMFFKGSLDLVFPFKYVILPEAVYNSIVSIVIFLIVLKINHWSEELDRLSRRY
ncbi:rod shape-determining protein MreD [Acetivibrio mesophilus]|uniref:Rod shape-determining protein MreD n=1 Tax=Acetivibrio mesophilus TaxID=2487273 RepID=A0A4Q0I429_9FIRM|nr:rod shape-determining protein MreD [Acetivibrio mesophilus]ODM26075.1 rod shape-determining protein MreD [Clostridium sp. Bc-iso-3]RXE59043.1 rod shape-determining protein MreD [Acetivibrio mesophilus]HHV28281.1 rod shape-determining protein MreD [Clostridium sp.]